MFAATLQFDPCKVEAGRRATVQAGPPLRAQDIARALAAGAPSCGARPNLREKRLGRNGTGDRRRRDLPGLIRLDDGRAPAMSGAWAAAGMPLSCGQAMVVAHQAVQAMGFPDGLPVSRLFRDAKSMEIGAGTSALRRLPVGGGTGASVE